MSTTTTTTTTETTTTNLNALLNNKKFVESIRLNEVKKAEKSIFDFNECKFLSTLIIGTHFSVALKYIQSDEAKESAKICNVKLTNENMAIIFGYSLAQFNRYKALSKLDKETIDKYTNSDEREKSLIGLLKFSNSKNEISEDKNEESDEETSVKIEPLQIKVGKDNKISIKGKASKEVLTLLIEELKKMMA